jgi:hypothetical protein
MPLKLLKDALVDVVNAWKLRRKVSISPESTSKLGLIPEIWEFCNEISGNVEEKPVEVGLVEALTVWFAELLPFRNACSLVRSKTPLMFALPSKYL